MTVEDLILFTADQLIEEKGLGAKAHVDKLLAGALEKGDPETLSYYNMMKFQVEKLLLMDTE